MTCIPRAIAPLVTITTSAPSWCARASRSHSDASSPVRSEPSPSATTLEPSLTTILLIGTDSASPAGDPRLAGVQLEGHAADLDLVSGLEALLLQGLDHADAAQALLEVGERLVVVEVEPLQQPLDPAAAHREGVVLQPLDLEALPRAGAEQHVLGQLVVARR